MHRKTVLLPLPFHHHLPRPLVLDAVAHIPCRGLCTPLACVHPWPVYTVFGDDRCIAPSFLPCRRYRDPATN